MTKEEEIEQKKLAIIESRLNNFWQWIVRSDETEEGYKLNLDKRIPGFASIIAVVLFLIREFIIYNGAKVVFSPI